MVKELRKRENDRESEKEREIIIIIIENREREKEINGGISERESSKVQVAMCYLLCCL